MPKTQIVLPLSYVLVQERVYLLDHHPKALGPLGFPVDFGVYITEKIGVLETTPASIGSSDRHTGICNRGNQFRAVLIHFGI